MKCSMCGQPWQDCDKHFLAEDVAHYKIMRIFWIAATVLLAVAAVVGLIVVPAIMLYG